MSEHFKTVSYQVKEAVIEITLNQPSSHNAISNQMHLEIKEAFRLAAHAPGARAIVFASTGKHFSAGGDFDAILADRRDAEALRRMEPEARELLMAIGDCPLPVVTALQGDAVGLGATLILATDAVVAARTARISDPHVMIGLAAGDGGCISWPLSTSFIKAKRYLLTGDRLNAEEAYAMGLVTDLVDAPEAVLPAARNIATRICALPPLAVAATKRVLNQIFRNRMDAVFEFGISAEMRTFVTEDVVEAISAFREKRTPNFRGN